MTTQTHGAHQRWRVLAASAIAIGAVLVAPPAGAASGAPVARPGATTRVIVQAANGNLASVTKAAKSLGAHVVSTQQSLSTMVVDLPANLVDDLRAVPGVRAATQDMRVHLSSDPSVTGSPGDLSNVADETGATDYWRNGFFGQGVDVALLDSGVLPVNGLLTPNKLVIGPDFSYESRSRSQRSLDTFGHGTHMAGIIAGLDSGLTPDDAKNDPTHFAGMAPGSRIVSLKLADAHGQTNVSQVVAGINWVVGHAHEPGLNIRVLNLSFGTDVTEDYRLDPLAHAAEVAWDSGIVVVVSAGNGTTPEGGLASPAYDPAVLAVGAVDTHGTADPSDDRVATFSKAGNNAQGDRGPDLLAPGVSLVSLRAPGSFIDKTQSKGRVGDRFFKGSGTSQAAAVVSGAAALMLSQRPQLSPDQVREVLQDSARTLGPAVSHDAQGAGALDLTTAQDLAAHMAPAQAPRARDTFTPFFRSPQPSRHGRRANPVASGGTMDGATWAGATWAGATWASDHWAGATWAGATWAGAAWASDQWDGATWAGATWAGATWAGATWAGATWAGATWADADWASAGWE